MGGIIGLTIRFSKEHEYRGSCWTNVLPEGLWAAPFYIDLDTSRAHTKAWLERLLKNRADNPEINDLWGGHDMLAPVEYGLVVVDYVTSTLMSAQGYSSPNWMARFDHDPDKVEKWEALERAGLLGDPMPWSDKFPQPPSRWIKLPFANVVCGDVDKVDATLQQWCEDALGLSDRERTAWAEYIGGREE